jgi:hypothetical protein
MSKGFKKIKKDGIFSKKFAITWKKIISSQRSALLIKSF